MKQSSPVGENLRKLILISKFYQNSYLENKSVSSVCIYVLVFYSFVCWVFVVLLEAKVGKKWHGREKKCRYYTILAYL